MFNLITIAVTPLGEGHFQTIWLLCLGDMNIVLIISHTRGIIHHEYGCWQKGTLNIRHNQLYSGSEPCNKHQKVSLHSTMKSWNGQFDCASELLLNALYKHKNGLHETMKYGHGAVHLKQLHSIVASLNAKP